jgi:hypothetical protein
VLHFGHNFLSSLMPTIVGIAGGSLHFRGRGSGTVASRISSLAQSELTSNITGKLRYFLVAQPQTLAHRGISVEKGF